MRSLKEYEDFSKAVSHGCRTGFMFLRPKDPILVTGPAAFAPNHAMADSMRGKRSVPTKPAQKRRSRTDGGKSDEKVRI